MLYSTECNDTILLVKFSIMISTEIYLCQSNTKITDSYKGLMHINLNVYK
jgi:hypothetical protein